MNGKILALIIGVVLVGVVGFQLLRRDQGLEGTTTQKIMVQNGEVIGVVEDVDENADLSEPVADDGDFSDDLEDSEDSEVPVPSPSSRSTGTSAAITTKEIMITNGVKHSVPLEDIRGGGPQKDGIPSIDDPKFTTVAEAEDTLTDEEPGIAFSRDGIARFYPFQILVFHEIVNDRFNGERVLITYCPLCLSGIVFDPRVQGKRVEFGTSGKLWNSNLVMYDRKTDTYWSQILGEAIVGEVTGSELTILPSDQMRFGQWKKLNPNGEVLSRDTGAFKFYGTDPYGDYYTTPGVFFPVGATDDRLENKDFVLGIVVNGQAKAYFPEAIKKVGVVEDEFQGKKIIAEYVEDIDAVRLYEEQSDGTRTRINPFPNFWFSWVGAHPDTELYK